MPESNEKSSQGILDAALSYSQRGWAVLPLHAPSTTRSCTCGRRHCTSPGKHPCWTGGSHIASDASDRIKQFFPLGANRNIAVACGRISNLVVLDVDFRHAGAESLAALEKRFSPLPKTLTVNTGGGGVHYYFYNHLVSIRNSAGTLGRGLDVRGEGGYVVAPPSLHTSGQPYTWARPGGYSQTAPPPMPGWLTRLLVHPTQRLSPEYASQNYYLEGSRNSSLMSLAGQMRRAGGDINTILAELFIKNELCCKPPLPSFEVRKIAGSVMRYHPEKSNTRKRTTTMPVKQMSTSPQKCPEAVDAYQASPKVGAHVEKIVSKKSAEHVRPAIGEDAIPWAQSVPGHLILDDIASVARRRLILNAPQINAMSLWVLFTYAHDVFTTSPMLAFVSPDKRCGKTTALSLLLDLARRPLPASNITTAALFRAVTAWQPTLLVDEADTFIENNEELMGVLNSGHRRDFAAVIRCSGDKHTPETFSTWSPKAIAKIGSLTPTLADRAIVISMRRKKVSEKVDYFDGSYSEDLAVLCKKAMRWAQDSTGALRAAAPIVPSALNDRAADNWRPLLKIADHAGGQWPALAREAATYFALDADKEDEESISALLLQDIYTAFKLRQATKLQSQDLATILADMEHRPWPEWRLGRSITPRQIAQILRPFKITPKSTRMSGLGTPKGYEWDQFADAFERYIDAKTLLLTAGSPRVAVLRQNDGLPGAQPKCAAGAEQAQ